MENRWGGEGSEGKWEQKQQPCTSKQEGNCKLVICQAFSTFQNWNCGTYPYRNEACMHACPWMSDNKLIHVPFTPDKSARKVFVTEYSKNFQDSDWAVCLHDCMPFSNKKIAPIRYGLYSLLVFYIHFNINSINFWYDFITCAFLAEFECTAKITCACLTQTFFG